MNLRVKIAFRNLLFDQIEELYLFTRKFFKEGMILFKFPKSFLQFILKVRLKIFPYFLGIEWF